MTTGLNAQRNVRSWPHLDRAAVDRICHEARRPLAVIQAYAELLEDQIAGPLNVEQLRQAEIIGISTRNLARMITDLQESFEALTGNIETHFGEHDLEAVVLALAEEYDAPVQARNVRLSVSSDGPLVHPRIDDRLLCSAIRRAVDNALVFGAEGGEISIQLRRTKNGARITIADAGPGVPGTKLEPIFQAFTRGDPPPGCAAAGLGLGLTVCRALVEILGGTARAQVRHPRGFSLVLHLPFAASRTDERRAEDERDAVRVDSTAERTP